MRWFVYIDNKIYGPYIREQLTTFLAPETRVAREGNETWTTAAEDPELADVLTGRIVPALEWHVSKPGKPFRGPFTRQALMAMIERKEVEPKDLVLHSSWTEAMPLGQTRLYAKWSDPTANLDEFSPAEIRNAPRPKSEHVPAPPKSRIRVALPRGGIALLVGASVLIMAYGVYVFQSAGSSVTPLADQPVVKACGGPPAGECKADRGSECICRDKPRFCGCDDKGECGMATCVAYEDMMKSAPPASAIHPGK
ncbi:MAG: DUF4339 domain-containing protein [Candidatus Hydrogenedentota bacterium]